MCADGGKGYDDLVAAVNGLMQREYQEKPDTADETSDTEEAEPTRRERKRERRTKRRRKEAEPDSTAVTSDEELPKKRRRKKKGSESSSYSSSSDSSSSSSDSSASSEGKSSSKKKKKRDKSGRSKRLGSSNKELAKKVSFRKNYHKRIVKEIPTRANASKGVRLFDLKFSHILYGTNPVLNNMQDCRLRRMWQVFSQSNRAAVSFKRYFKTAEQTVAARGESFEARMALYDAIIHVASHIKAFVTSESVREYLYLVSDLSEYLADQETGEVAAMGTDVKRAVSTLKGALHKADPFAEAAATRETQRSQPATSNSPNQARRCFGCHQLGHIQANCPRRRLVPQVFGQNPGPSFNFPLLEAPPKQR